MWLSDRRTFLAAALALGACGFTPAYGPNGGAKALRGAVEIDAPGDRETFGFTARLEDRLGRVTSPKYRLRYGVTTTPVGAGITQTGAITRYSLTGSAKYRLEDATGGVVTEGVVESFTSWSTTGSTVATLTSEDDAYRRLMVILADQVVTRLTAAVAG